MSFRLPEIPTLKPSAINMPGLRVDAATAQGRALEGVAQEIAGVSEHFHNTALKIQQVDNARLISETRQQLAADYQKHLLDLDKNPNPTERISKTREFISLKESELKNKGLPPAVRDQAFSHFGEFASRAMIEQGATAAKLANQRATIALDNELRAATASGNRQAYIAALDTAQEAGISLPEEKEKFLSSFDRTTTGTTIDLAIQEEPGQMLEELARPDFLTRFPGITRQDIPRLQSAARKSAQRKRAEEMDLIQAALSGNNLQPDDIEAAQYLSPNDRAKVKHALDAVQRAQPPTPEQHAQAWDTLLKLREDFTNPAITDRDFAAHWNDTRAQVLSIVATTPPAFREDITGELQRRSPANRSASRMLPPVGTDKAELKAIAVDRVSRASKAGTFGPIAEDAEAPAREKAYRKAEEIRLQVSQWIEKHADEGIGIQEVGEFTDSLISGERVKSNATDLLPFVPGGGLRFRPPSVMPPLPPKQGAKDLANPDPLELPAGDADATDALLPARQQLETFLNPQP